ncbi:MAG TPA: hypothetical protein VIL60_07000 [Rhodanobacter sp.]
MNVQIAVMEPLSATLLAPGPTTQGHPARRHSVGQFLLRTEALAHFNELLMRLHHFPLDPDQLATASRDLAVSPTAGQRAARIEQRLQVVNAVNQMIADRNWSLAREAVEPARVVVDYVHSDHELIPESLPLVGRLDDAILVDAAWPQLADEVDSYLDYCRLREIEAEMRGCEVTAFTFTRDDWQQERVAEANLISHCHHVSERSYVPASTVAYFHVH